MEDTDVEEKPPKKFRTITVEPTVIFYYTTYIILDFLNTNLYIQKKCRFNTTSSEPDLNTPCDNEKNGISFVASVNYNFRFALVSLMVVHVVLSSSWSDKAGRLRKPFIIIPIIGQILQILCACIQSYFWILPVQIAVATDIIFQVLSGGFVLCLNTCMTYITDISSTEDRTTKMGILFAIQVICAPIGSGISGYLLRLCGFLYSYVVCLILTVLALFCGYFFIEDISFPMEKKPSVWNIFSLSGPVESVKLVFRKSLGKNRAVVLTLLVIHITVWFNMEGQKSVFYLYFRYRFKWDERFYSFYVMCKLIGLTFGTFFCSLILSKYYQLHDGIIGSFASFWDTVTSICYTFAREPWQIYLIPALDIFHGAAISVHYSYISKFFKSNEYGQLMSALNVFSLFIPICHPIFSYIYEKTMDTFPSAFFLVGGAFDFITFLLYGFSYYLCKKTES